MCAELALAPAVAAPPAAEWHGRALGAPGRIRLVHPQDRRARRVLAQCRAEIERLERLFSLHRPDSALVRLNASGACPRLDGDFLALIERAQSLSALTGGAFDISVQPLWQLYSQHFARTPQARHGPPPDAVEQARRRVGWQRITAGSARIELPPGMALTCNGIAQGYITDRVTELLRDAGFEHVLVQLGEARSLGRAAPQRDWRLGLVDPTAPWQLAGHVALRERALASSGGYGTPLSADGEHHHLFDPTSGRSAHAHAGVSVMAPQATLADALATAFAVLPAERSLALAQPMPGVALRLTDAAGGVRALRWPGDPAG